ncbi:UBP-type zinc finger domain-containing protein [Paraburkholderia sp. D1E]|uniref:UBP-type zinc finger domain-containing protein n=1 Tax=Paraburkholderia sp. D1E TaxID=3461398 RepID=UPI004045E7EB
MIAIGSVYSFITDKDYCEECVRSGQSWVHLRLCLTCGHVGCCDSSTNRHASKHRQETGHPLVRSIEPGERWVWCYVISARLKLLTPMCRT